jgi:hypothetical protein
MSARGVVAVELGGRFIGFDNDLTAYNAAKVRMGERFDAKQSATPRELEKAA